MQAQRWPASLSPGVVRTALLHLCVQSLWVDSIQVMGSGQGEL